MTSLLKRVAVTIKINGVTEEYWKEYRRLERQIERLRKQNPYLFLTYGKSILEIAEQLLKELEKVQI